MQFSPQIEMSGCASIGLPDICHAINEAQPRGIKHYESSNITYLSMDS